MRPDRKTPATQKFGLILVCSTILLAIHFLQYSSRFVQASTVTLAGSYGDSDDSYYFPISGTGIHVVPTNDDEKPIIYLSDTKLCVVRRIIGNSSQVIAGTGLCGVSSVDSAPGPTCMLNNPSGIHYDATANFLYILDYSTIRLLDLTSGIMSKMIISFSESRITAFSQPTGITMYKGDIYVADTGVGLVWKIKIATRNVGTATVALGTLVGTNNYCNIISPTSCKLTKPTSVSFYPGGIMVVSDVNRIIMVSENLAYVAPLSFNVNPVQAIAYDESNILISDSQLSQFVLYNKDQKQTTKILNYGWNMMTYFGILNLPDGSKKVYFLTGLDKKTNRNQVISFTFNTDGILPVTNTYPVYGIYDSFGFNSPHTALDVFLPNPQQMRVTSNNELYFPAFHTAIMKLDLNTGMLTRIAGSISQFGYNQDSIPATIALLFRPNTVIKLDSGDLIISDSGNNRIRKIDTNGIITTIVGTGNQGNNGNSGPANQLALNGPQGLAAPPPGLAGQFIFDFSDSDNNRILRLQNDMTVTLVISEGIRGANAIIYTPNGDMYIANQNAHQIMKYSNSKLTVVAGNGYGGYSGDGGQAINAKLNFPSDVTVSSNGEVYIADWGNGVVRKVFRNGTIITLVNNSGYIGSELNGVTMTTNDDLLYSGGLTIKLYMTGNSGSCVDKNTCNNHGACTNGKCVCDSGWRGNLNCGAFSCDTPKPVHGSTCIGPNQYSCINGWTGNNCEIPVCFGTPSSNPSVCNSHGQCVSNDTCTCESGWRGNLNCGAFSCDTPKPVHGSACIGPNQYSCINGWTGNNCEIPVCFGTPSNNPSVCNSHGQCVSNDTCTCESGWRGKGDCSAFSCDVVSPHSTGKCIGPNTYECQYGWIGDLCDIPLCDGIPATNPSVCNSHGQCISNNTCNCFSGWRGNTICTVYTCDGVNNCQPHGQCISNNTCKCIDGYGGNGCNDYSCFGLWGQAGCNNNGNCVSTNKCSCFSLYFGDRCEWIDCDPSSNEFTINSTKGCSSNGLCKVINDKSTGQNSTVCKCDDGFDGNFCQDRAGSGGVAAAVVICLLIIVYCIVGIIVTTAIIYYKRKGSKSEEFEHLIPHSFNEGTMETGEPASINSSSSYRSTNSFKRSQQATSNTQDHFYIREKEYVKSKKLGSGTSGQVFMFEETSENEQVAVKIIEVLNPNGSEFKEVVNMFELSEESNPYIVPILGCTMVENGGFICILMPLYKCDLRGWAYNNQDSIPIELIVEIVRQITSALQYLHSKNMVHRDLKQTNIFIANSSDISKKVDVSSFRLCVGDWGSSRYQNRSNLTAYEGTIQYSSPESIVKGEFSLKSDVWSLGCILYQLLSTDYASCLMRMKQVKSNDEMDVEILKNVEKNLSKKVDRSNKLYKVCCDLLLEMIRYNPEERISTEEILSKLQQDKLSCV